MIRLLSVHCFFGPRNDALYLGVDSQQMLIFLSMKPFDYLFTLYFIVSYVILYVDLTLLHSNLVLFRLQLISYLKSQGYSSKAKRSDQIHFSTYFTSMMPICVYQRTLSVTLNRKCCFTYSNFQELHQHRSLNSGFQLVQTHLVRKQCYLHHL